MTSGQVEGSDGEVAEGGHGPWPGAGADLGMVFAVEGVAHPVDLVLDGPVAADNAGDRLGAGAGGVEAGDAEGGDVGQRRAVPGGGVPLGQVGLGDGGGRQAARGGHDLYGAGFGPAAGPAPG